MGVLIAFSTKLSTEIGDKPLQFIRANGNLAQVGLAWSESHMIASICEVKVGSCRFLAPGQVNQGSFAIVPEECHDE